MFDNKIKINGIEINYTFDGVYAHVKLSKNESISMDKHVQYMHTLDRSHYRWPNCINGCACPSCNDARKQHNERKIGWSRRSVHSFGIVTRFNMSAAAAEQIIESELR